MGVGILRTGAIGLVAFLHLWAQQGAELRMCVHADPATFDPLLAVEEASETVRYLTSGVLIRFNRQTQQLEPELASSWKVGDGGRRIDFILRPNLRFSNGDPLTAADVSATIRRLSTPDLHSAIADTLRTAGGEIQAIEKGPNIVSLSFAAPVAGFERLFDQVTISSAAHPSDRSVVLGPFVVESYKSGQYVLLRRNPYYWKTGPRGERLPLLDFVRLDIQSNRDIELFRFRKRELHLVDKLEPEAFERLEKEMLAAALNVGESLDTEFFWFNQSPSAQIPRYKRGWFESRAFRQALSAAVNRDDIIRLVYRGYAHKAVGPISKANRFWFNTRLQALEYNPHLAIKLLEENGFRLEQGNLRDRQGNAVEISLITNAGNRSRVQMGRMLQQDLAKIGIKLNFSPIEFQSLIERIAKTQQYEACLLGLTNVDTDPNDQMNVWSSSGSHHPWNPTQARPATAWEREIDSLMKEQHVAVVPASRKRAFDRVQEIISLEMPIVPLVHPDVLVAISPDVSGTAPSALHPHLFWNIEYLRLAPAARRRKD